MGVKKITNNKIDGEIEICIRCACGRATKEQDSFWSFFNGMSGNKRKEVGYVRGFINKLGIAQHEVVYY